MNLGKRMLLVVVVVTLCSIATSGSFGTASAQVKITGPDDVICRSRFSGTYLTTIQDSQGDFASRSIVTMHRDGNLSVTDSGEFAGMFGHQQGSYRCTEIHSAKAITLDFSFSDPDTSGDIARSDWVIVMTPEGSIAGEITVNFYRPLETCNPFEEPSPCDVTPLDTFTFTSVQVAPLPSQAPGLPPPVHAPLL